MHIVQNSHILFKNLLKFPIVFCQPESELDSDVHVLLSRFYPDFLETHFIQIFNLFVTSKNEVSNSPIHEFKVLHKNQRAF